MAAQDANSSDLLYHVKRTTIDYLHDPSGATRYVDIVGTYTSLQAAKAYAYQAIEKEGLSKEEFETYEEKDKTPSWTHGDGVLVFAKAAAGQIIKVGIDTTVNSSGYKGNTEGVVDASNLHYVVQTKIDYDADRSGARQTANIEGTYTTRDAARKAAKTVLLDQSDEVTKESFEEYDERDEKDPNWQYGDDVWVHAAASTGENFLVSVKTQPGVHRQHHAKK